MPDSDATLLQSFAANRSEKVFRALADRYLGLIYHTALRRTGNRPLSEEISQNVLCALARKAGALARNPERLAAWLHRATTYESLKAMRSESAHQRRKQLQHPDEIPGPSAASPWTDALPILDDSLGKLPESDRTVLLLHFYENQSFPQISRTLGKSTDAVQKQSRRALEKLSRLLRGKGVALSITGIATGLSAEFAKAAPISLATTSSAAALSALAETPASLLTVLAMKPKVLIPATLIVCAIPLVFQHQAISSANSRHTELLAKHSKNPGVLYASNSSRSLPTNTRLRLTADFDTLRSTWDEIRRANTRLHYGGTNPRAEAYASALEAFDTATLVRLIREGAASPHFQEKRDETLRTVILTLAKRDPRLALNTALESFPADSRFALSAARAQLGAVLGHWAAADPIAAEAWFGDANSKGLFETRSDLRNRQMVDLRIPLIDSLITSAPELARKMIGEMPPDEHSKFLGYFPALSRNANTGLAFDKTGGRVPPLTKDYSLGLLGLMREFSPAIIGEQMEMLLVQLSKTDTESFLAEANLNEDERLAAATFYAKTSRKQAAAPDGTVSETVDEWRADLVQQLAPGLYVQLLGNIRDEQREQQISMAEMQLEQLRQHPSPNDDFISMILSTFNFETHTEAALEQANRIQDPERRRKVTEKLQRKP